MITSKEIIKVSEEWLESVKVDGGLLVDVYENPTSSDYAKICRTAIYGIRFIADNNAKKVYVWDAYNAIHNDIASSLGLLYQIDKKDPNLLAGDAKLSGGKATFTGSTILGVTFNRLIKKIEDSKGIISSELQKEIDSRLNTDWSWANRYIDCSKVIDKFKKEVNKVISRSKKK